MFALKRFGAAAIVAAASAGFAIPAHADACSDDMAKVEEAVATAQLTAQDMEAVQDLIEEARAKQAAGDSQGCSTTLAEAKTVLEIE